MNRGMIHSLEGQLLIAAPRMHDPNFDRSVVLLLRHDENGAVGIILNRPLSADANGPWQLLDVLKSEHQRQIQMGGPVSGPLIVLHGRKAGEASRPGAVFVVEEREQLENLVQQADAPLRFFVGHAGWGGGQLEAELEQGVWLTTPADPDFVFADHDDMWVSALRETGRVFYREVLSIDSFPDDASLN
jgi:putative transcriptional regulator